MASPVVTNTPQIAASEPLFVRALHSFGSNVISSKKVSAAVSFIFGALMAAASSTPAGLFAAASTYLVTENIRMRATTTRATEWKDAADALLIKADVKIKSLREDNERLKTELDSRSEVIEEDCEEPGARKSLSQSSFIEAEKVYPELFPDLQ